MNRFVNRKGIAGIVIVSALVASFMLGTVGVGHGKTLASDAGKAWSYDQFVHNIAAHHKAPFASKMLATKSQVQSYANKMQQRTRTFRPNNNKWTNIKVNQDRNPWPKAGVAAAVSPHDADNYVVASNDFRQGGSGHIFYHVSTDKGKTWSDDSLGNGIDPTTLAPYTYQYNPGVAYDRNGHSYLSALSGNLLVDLSSNNYANMDTEVDVTQGFAHGTYTNFYSTPIDYVSCNGNPTSPDTFNCPGQLEQPLITVDNNRDSPTRDSIYVYYTYFCMGVASSNVTPTTPAPCMDGKISIPPFSSVILESHSAGAGLPFTAPAVVSGPLTQAQYSDMVIDEHGVPHIFFDDFSSMPWINMYESTLWNDTWTVTTSPLTTFQYYGLDNSNWNFRNSSTVTPGCGIKHEKAFCAFAASEVVTPSGTTKTTSTPQVYLATIDTVNGNVARIIRVNNDDDNGFKDHFFPWAAVSPQDGDIMVGWYDNRHDPLNAKVEYFVGESMDNGETIGRQQAVSDTSFNPCVGFPNCSYFGDYYQLVVGPDDITHATWADTRDGVSMQLYTQPLKW